MRCVGTRFLTRIGLGGFFFGVFVASAIASDEAVFWNQVALETIKTTNTAPPMAARNLAIASIAAYDAVNSIDRIGKAYVFKDNYAGADARAAVAEANYRTLRTLFPSQASTLTQIYQDRLNLLGSGTSVERGLEAGRRSAATILNRRENDGAYTNLGPYWGRTEVGKWRPTDSGLPGALPHWRDVATFSLNSTRQFDGGSAPILSSAQYAEALNEVKIIGSATSVLRTPDQTEIAYFWKAGGNSYTPPGQWNQIAQTIGQNRGNTLADNVRMFGALNTSLADAGIAAWEVKYTDEMWRPETAIRLADQDGNDETAPDLTWNPLLPTPNHPSCVSGHSTFSGAAAASLAALYGDQQSFSFTDDTYGITRHFNSFSQAMDEAGMSRIYGGIHYSFDNEIGKSLGWQIGKHVVATTFQAVPEPITLLSLGLASAALVRRRRKR